MEIEAIVDGLDDVRIVYFSSIFLFLFTFLSKNYAQACVLKSTRHCDWDSRGWNYQEEQRLMEIKAIGRMGLMI